MEKLIFGREEGIPWKGKYSEYELKARGCKYSQEESYIWKEDEYQQGYLNLLHQGLTTEDAYKENDFNHGLSGQFFQMFFSAVGKTLYNNYKEYKMCFTEYTTTRGYSRCQAHRLAKNIVQDSRINFEYEKEPVDVFEDQLILGDPYKALKYFYDISSSTNERERYFEACRRTGIIHIPLPKFRDYNLLQIGNDCEEYPSSALLNRLYHISYNRYQKYKHLKRDPNDFSCLWSLPRVLDELRGRELDGGIDEYDLRHSSLCDLNFEKTMSIEKIADWCYDFSEDGKMSFGCAVEIAIFEQEDIIESNKRSRGFDDSYYIKRSKLKTPKLALVETDCVKRSFEIMDDDICKSCEQEDDNVINSNLIPDTCLISVVAECDLNSCCYCKGDDKLIDIKISGRKLKVCNCCYYVISPEVLQCASQQDAPKQFFSERCSECGILFLLLGHQIKDDSYSVCYSCLFVRKRRRKKERDKGFSNRRCTSCNRILTVYNASRNQLTKVNGRCVDCVIVYQPSYVGKLKE